MSTQISTQISEQDLLQFTHLLHCKLRKKVTGLSALNEIENIMLFRFIEERKDIKLKDDITFSKICEKYASDDKIKEDKKEPTFNKRNCYKLWEAVYDTSNDDNNCMILEYHNNHIIRKYIKSSVHKISIFTDKDKALLSPLIQELFNMVYNKFKNVKFDSSFYDMFGSAHEEFKTNAHGNGGKHTGQHFTPMDIKRLVAEELKVKSTEKYYEPCAGTGGFVHTIDKYVREKEGDTASKKFKNNIYANEYNAEIIKPLMINMLLHDIPVTNIHERDSLSNENCELMKGLADVIGTNYPFGMSNTIDLSDYSDKKYWGSLVRGKSIIKNSSGQFIMHIYHSLKDNGRAGFVSDRGILNNGDEKSWENDLRKFIIKNTNVYKIWLLPTGVFPYTNFATCVIFLRKGEKTKKVEIFEGKFKDEKNKFGLCIEDKPIKIFTLKELEENNYSLKMEEKKEEIKKGWVKLGDVVEFGKKSNHKASDATENGKYTYYTSSSVKKKSDYCDYEDYHIILGTGGSANINYDKKFSCSADNFTLKKDDKKYILIYIYYYLKINMQILNNGFTGAGLKHLNKNYVENIQIPSLSLYHQEEIVDFLDEQFRLYDINLLAKQIKDIPLFNLLIERKYDLFADALHLIYRKMELDALHTKIEKDKKAVFNIRLNGLNCKEYKLGDIVDFNIGGTPSTKESSYWNGKYKWCTISDLNGNIIDKTEKTITKEGIDNSSVKSINKGSILVSFKLSIGKIGIAGSDMYCNEAIMFFKHKNNITNTYLMYYFKFVDFSKGLKNGNIGNGSLNKGSLRELIIPIPSLQDQENIIKEIEQIEATQSTYAEYSKMIQSQIESINKVIDNLTKLNKKNNDNKEESNSSNDSDDSSESDKEEKIEVKPKKIIKSKQTKKVETSSESESNSSDSSEEEKPKKIKSKLKKEVTISESETENSSES